MKKIAIHYLVVNGYASPAQAQAWVDKHGWEVVMAAAEKQELVQAQRRMPTAVPSIPKIEEEEDFMDGMLKYMLVSNLIGAGAAEEYTGTSSVTVGQTRPWPTMTPMV